MLGNFRSELSFKSGFMLDGVEPVVNESLRKQCEDETGYHIQNVMLVSEQG